MVVRTFAGFAHVSFTLSPPKTPFLVIPGTNYTPQTRRSPPPPWLCVSMFLFAGHHIRVVGMQNNSDSSLYGPKKWSSSSGPSLFRVFELRHEAGFMDG